MNPFWVVAGFVILACLAIALWNSRDREIVQSQLEHSILWFIQTKKDGGRLVIEHTATGLQIALTRQHQRNGGCAILLELLLRPSQKWEPLRERLKVELDRQLFQSRVQPLQGDALQLTIPVPDVNAPDAGVRTARAVTLVLGLVGVGSSERLKVTSTGENSVRLWRPTAERWAEDGNPVLKRVARSTLRELQNEEKEETRNREEKEK